MKIACIGYLHGAGGAERQIIMLANALAEKGNSVHLLALAECQKSYGINASVIVHDLTKAEKSRNPILSRFKILKKELKEIQPDIIINYWLQSVYFCALMRKSITGKIIYSERGDPGSDEYKGLLGVIRRLAFYRVSGFVFQSDGAQDYFGGRITSKSVVIHNSVYVPADRFHEPCNNREKKIVSVGRLHPQKNQPLLINAFADIADEIEEYTLDIYGSGQLETKLNNLICERRMESKIILKGTVGNIHDYVYNASLFVLSSDYEGLPNALMEAMAIGVPCVSTDCKPGGVRTLIKDGVNGWIIPLGDRKALSTAIVNVLSNKERAETIASEAFKLRDSHTATAVFDKWENFLTEIYQG